MTDSFLFTAYRLSLSANVLPEIVLNLYERADKEPAQVKENRKQKPLELIRARANELTEAQLWKQLTQKRLKSTQPCPSAPVPRFQKKIERFIKVCAQKP